MTDITILQGKDYKTPVGAKYGYMTYRWVDAWEQVKVAVGAVETLHQVSVTRDGVSIRIEVWTVDNHFAERMNGVKLTYNRPGKHWSTKHFKATVRDGETFINVEKLQAAIDEAFAQEKAYKVWFKKRAVARNDAAAAREAMTASVTTEFAALGVEQHDYRTGVAANVWEDGKVTVEMKNVHFDDAAEGAAFVKALRELVATHTPAAS